MSIQVVNINDLCISDNRQRREFKPEQIVELANSITTNGLLHPLVIREVDGKKILVAGERRLKAMQYVWAFGEKVRCGKGVYEEHELPCISIGELSDLDAFEAELEENIRRADLTWQERATATSELAELRRLQAEKRGEPLPTVNSLAVEIHGGLASDPTQASGSATDSVRKEIIVSKFLDDPDVAKAKSADDAFKIIKRKEETRKNAERAVSVGATLTASSHTLLRGDCLDILPTLAAESFDIILTDPPYGIDAHEFGDSGGMTPGAHFYDDSYETWAKLMVAFSIEAYRVAAADAHAYVFCDIQNFVILRGVMAEAGWKPFRTPIIYVNPSASRAPWPEQGPQRKYQVCLYAVKGSKTCTRLYGDVVTVSSDPNLGHMAQKPVALYEDLLRRSARPGDRVLDPFAGSGPVFPAAHGLKCIATGIELNDAAAGICVKRLEGLK